MAHPPARPGAPFLAALLVEHRDGHCSYETAQHLKHEFRRLGASATSADLAEAVDQEVGRLEHQAATLRRLRGQLLDGTGS